MVKKPALARSSSNVELCSRYIILKARMRFNGYLIFYYEISKQLYHKKIDML